MHRLSFPRAVTARLLPLSLLAALLGGCTFGQPPEPTPLPIVIATAVPAPNTGATVHTVRRGAVVNEASFPGKVTLSSVQDLFFGTSGRVRAIYVGSGDRVAADQLLAELDTRDLQFDLEAAQLAVKAAEQRLADGQIEFSFDQLEHELDLQRERLRLAQLKVDPNANPNAVAIQELAVKQADMALQRFEGGMASELQTQLERANIGLRKAQAVLDDASIVAPFAGQVLLYDALEKGKPVQAFVPVASLVDPTTLVVEANLVPADLEPLREGMPVQIRVTTPLSRSVAGVIQTLPQPFGTGADSVTRIAPTGDNADLLRPGANVTIVADLGRADDALWLPPEAVQGYKGNYFVRLRDGTEAPVEGRHLRPRPRPDPQRRQRRPGGPRSLGLSKAMREPGRAG